MVSAASRIVPQSDPVPLDDMLSYGRQIIEAEAAGLAALHAGLDARFAEAVSLILSCYGLAVLPTSAFALFLVALGVFGYSVDVQAGDQLQRVRTRAAGGDREPGFGQRVSQSSRGEPLHRR